MPKVYSQRCIKERIRQFYQLTESGHQVHVNAALTFLQQDLRNVKLIYDKRVMNNIVAIMTTDRGRCVV